MNIIDVNTSSLTIFPRFPIEVTLWARWTPWTASASASRGSPPSAPAAPGLGGRQKQSMDSSGSQWLIVGNSGFNSGFNSG